MSTMNVDTIFSVEDGLGTVERLNQTGGVIRKCNKVSVSRDVEHVQIGNTYFFPERVFFRYNKKGRKISVRIVPYKARLIKK